ncbi:MAG: bifunctional phosphoribosyl-AMP cyclohydrolase/phosphoribosyl-ATP diphosphatase HisIE [Rhodobacteraceae bacterium]|nr:bifunctional phosphoribosyl-AMP cyclohydrolase/phosphoribosyl-ATP diphosphatase HisIE [Paracoccaceae bacterium]
MTIAQQINWEKVSGLIPAIVQDANDLRILMLGFMNREALEQTVDTGRVTFFSRSRQTLWTKGDTSGNFLDLVSLEVDCDGDTILIKAHPQGPVCHTGTSTCFNDELGQPLMFLNRLERLIKTRNQKRPEGSYTTTLFNKGAYKIAQKVGEEGVELALAKVKEDRSEILNEAADLMFHIMVLLESSGLGLDEVSRVLAERFKESKR